MKAWLPARRVALLEQEAAGQRVGDERQADGHDEAGDGEGDGDAGAQTEGQPAAPAGGGRWPARSPAPALPSCRARPVATRGAPRRTCPSADAEGDGTALRQPGPDAPGGAPGGVGAPPSGVNGP